MQLNQEFVSLLCSGTALQSDRSYAEWNSVELMALSVGHRVLHNMYLKECLLLCITPYDPLWAQPECYAILVRHLFLFIEQNE